MKFLPTLQALAARALSPLLWFLLMSIVGPALIVCGVFMLVGGGWALILAGCFLALGAVLISRGMMNG